MNRDVLYEMHAFLFDLDGCVYFGDTPAEGAGQLLRLLMDEGKNVFFITNNSTETSMEISAKLNLMGLPANPRQVITATELTGRYISDHYGRMKVKAAGSDSLRASIELAGHTVLPDESREHADIVVIGRDTRFTYEKLLWIAEAERQGAKVIGTNPDAYHLGSRREKIPETGALLAAAQTVISKNIEYVGKPNPYLYQYAAKTLGLRPGDCVMVGDNINTDMLGGFRAGTRTVWIKGEENGFIPNEEAGNIRPDLVVKSIKHLYDLYKGEAI